VSFVTDIIDIGVCPGFCINKNKGKWYSTGLQSPNIGYGSAFQTFLCYGTLILSEFGCGTHTS